MRTSAPRRGPAAGFSFIELITVVALMALITSSAAPATSSLFQRHREMVLRENLLTIRKAVSIFPHNLYDDDADSEVDEDSRGDMNHDGAPGIRGIDDDGDLKVDEDWARRTPFGSYGRPNPGFDWSCRRDDDEDGIVDEEAFPSDLNDMAMKVSLLHKAIPVDPTLNVASWDTVLLNSASIPNGPKLANNDLDWYVDVDSNFAFTKGVDHIVISTDAVFHAADDFVLVGSPSEGAVLVRLLDEDPRNHIDDDEDGRTDEDAADMLDVRSLNSAQGLNLTSYSEW